MKKRIICLALLIIMVLSLSSCVVEQKYDYKTMAKYVTIPTVSGHEVKVDLDQVQMTIDQDIISMSTDKCLALSGDDIEVFITIQEYKIIGTDSTGGDIDQRGEVWFTSDSASTEKVKEAISIKNLGAGSFNTEIENRLLKSRIGETTTENDFIIPADLSSMQANYPQAYEQLAPHVGKRAFFTYSFTSRPVKEGDVVSVTYTGYEIDDAGNIKIDANGKEVTFSGGSGTSTVYIGSQTFIKDFEIGLIGLSVGKEGQFKATFPDDYGAEGTDAAKLNGKTVIFKATINTIYATEKYDLEYIKSTYGDKYESIEAFENALIDSYAAQQIVEYLVSNTIVLDYPSKEYKLLKKQLEAAEVTLVQQYKNQGVESLEDYIKLAGFESLDAYIKSVLKAEMAYYAYAEANGLVVTDGDIENAKNELINIYTLEYLQSSSTITEAEAAEYATQYVEEELTQADLYQEALYAVVGDHLVTQYTLTKNPTTFTSVTKGGSLFDKAE